MVSRETLHSKKNVSADFAAGVISVSGTFFHTQSARIDQYGFQIKLPHKNYELLRQVRDIIGLTNQIRIYKEGATRYAILLTRSRKTLLNRVIPFIDDRLYGNKLADYLEWKKNLTSNNEVNT